jgi:nitroimidazol reductase NimA-like FMN-containing flavoprotein (pyridoxamine 5'-phosphate oxidase superfamily)
MENLRCNPKVCFEVDIPLSYLGVDFNPEKNPCRAHHLYHSVIIRGMARILSERVEAVKKAEILNELVAKYESSRSFSPVTQRSQGFAACRVVEIGLERVSGKSELAQSSPQRHHRQFILQRLVERGWPEDIEAVKSMKKL